MRYLNALRASSRVPLLQTVKAAIATVAAWMIAGLVIRDQLPVFGAVAALLVVQPSLNQTISRALERSAGVIAGVLVAYLVGLAFGDNYWIVLLTIVIAIGVAWVLRVTPTTNVQIPISAMLVLAVGANTTQYAAARIVDTIIGAAIGVIVNVLIVPPVTVAPARDAVDALLDEIAARIDAIAAALRSPMTSAQLDELHLLARLLRPMSAKTDAALAAAAESLANNPRRGRHQAELEQANALAERLRRLVTRTLAMTRTLRDRYDPSLPEHPSVVLIAEEARRAAHDLRLLRLTPGSTPAEAPASEPPALTAPLSIARPDPEDWILIGSLVEDLRRIHEEIAGDDGL